MSARRVVLLRHGRTEWNAARRFQGQADPPLDAVGHAQAYEVAAMIAALHPDLLVSSDAARAAQTAGTVGAAVGLPVRLEPAFRERSLGHWEGLTRDEVAERYPDEFADWIAGRDVSRRGGETRDEVAVRAGAAFAALPAVGCLVVVTHSATAMALTHRLLGVAQETHVLGPLANCHWSELSSVDSGPPASGFAPADEAGWRLRAHNVGAPGTVVPLPLHAEGLDDASDADA